MVRKKIGRNKSLVDFAGIREVVIAHNAMLRARPAEFETDDGEDGDLNYYFAA